MVPPRPDRNWLVAFDLDDTLFSEDSFILSGFDAIENALRRLFSAEGFAKKAWAWYQLGERDKIFSLTLDELGLPQDTQTIEFIERLYTGHTPAIATFPDVIPCLQTLHMRAAVTILTDGVAALQQRKINALKLDHFIHRAVFTDEWGREFWKPHTRGYLELQEWMGLPPHKCLYVGDNPQKDFDGARKLGWHCLRIRRREGRYAALEASDELGMIPYCRDFSEFYQFVQFKDPEASIGQ